MKKKWLIKTKNGKKVSFYPVFAVNTQGDIEAKDVIVKEGENEYILNYLDLFMFCYFIGNEEQRRKLLNLQMRTIREIPYDVTFVVSSEEKDKGVAKRRIVLPIDDIIHYYALMEARKSQALKKLKVK